MPPSIGFTTFCVRVRSLASSPMTKSKVYVILRLLMVHPALELWSLVSVMRVGMSKEGSVLPAYPILVYPVPLSMTATLVLISIKIYL
jgi:hypothetical protein